LVIEFINLLIFNINIYILASININSLKNKKTMNDQKYKSQLALLIDFVRGFPVKQSVLLLN